MNTIDNIKNYFQNLQSGRNSQLQPLEQQAFESFNRQGVPTVRHEEWKYTRIGAVLQKGFAFPEGAASITAQDLDAVRLPGHEAANELVFVNGRYEASLSTIRSSELTIQSLQQASENEYKNIVAEHLGHSSRYIKDGMQALNTAFVHEGIFISIKDRKIVAHPLYIYHITDARHHSILAQPRVLLHVGEDAQVQLAETYATLGSSDSFVNQVLEIIVEAGALVEHCKLQNDRAGSSQVGTTHFRQVGKSHVHSVTITLNGGTLRNNLNMVLDAPHSEAHLYGLYFVDGQTHADNHTLVDHAQPNCMSNELYKGIMGGQSVAVFNGKIMVRQDAQKTNAFQSNKNILLSEAASVNTKPQLEIFADDVKCSHGCTVGQLDDEGLFYLRSRGISEDTARSLLVRAFVVDILGHIKPEALRTHIDGLIAERLELK